METVVSTNIHLEYRWEIPSEVFLEIAPPVRSLEWNCRDDGGDEALLDLSDTE